MSLNDPFGRMERRHQIAYESMRDRLRRAGIQSPQAAIEVIRQSRKRAFKIVGASGVLAVLTALLLPQAAQGTFIMLLLIIAWVINSFVNGQRYIKRFIKEDLEDKPANG